VAGERVRAANAVYGSSKAGLDGLAAALGDATWGTGVRVMVVRPGFVRTKMTADLPDGPLATTPERVAADTVRGLEKGAEIVWSPPVLRAVMAVLRHVPRPVFRRLPV
jgi:decaprenylphospho-beta-D-erythro-pentofuranosid-2-ulose 2-reductase